MGLRLMITNCFSFKHMEWKSLSPVWLFVTPWIYSPWDSPGQTTRVGSHCLLQGIFPTQGWNPGLPNCRLILYQLSHQGSPQAYGIEFNYSPSLDLCADKDTFQEFKTMEQDIYWKQDQSLRVLHWLPSNFYFTVFVVQSCPTLSTPWTAACQASLSFIISRSFLQLMPIESVMPSNHPVFCRPPFLPSIFPSIRVFSSKLALYIR